MTISVDWTTGRQTRSSLPVRVSNAQILDDGFHIGRVAAPQYRLEQDAIKAIRGLNYLQTGRNAPVHSGALEQCLKFHMEYMSQEVLFHINYVDWNDSLFGLWNDKNLGDPAAGELEFDVTCKTLLVWQPDFFDRILRHEFTLWVINPGTHWMSIILHVDQGHVAHYSINEPNHNAPLTQLIDDRLRRLLATQRIAVAPNARQNLWFPRQNDTYTCGLRTYEILRVFLERLNERSHQPASAAAGRLYDAGLWGPLSGDFQPHKVRALMLGICAGRALKHQAYRARVAIAPRERIRGILSAERDVSRLDAFDGLEAFQSPPGVRPGTRAPARRGTVGARPRRVSGLVQLAQLQAPLRRGRRARTRSETRADAVQLELG